MKYTFEKLNKENFSKYYDYLSLATALEPEIMCSTDINKEELYERLDDELTKEALQYLLCMKIRWSGESNIIFIPVFKTDIEYAMLTGCMYCRRIEIKE